MKVSLVKQTCLQRQSMKFFWLDFNNPFFRLTSSIKGTLRQSLELFFERKCVVQ